jgi:hypothetical protein
LSQKDPDFSNSDEEVKEVVDKTPKLKPPNKFDDAERSNSGKSKASRQNEPLKSKRRDSG